MTPFNVEYVTLKVYLKRSELKLFDAAHEGFDLGQSDLRVVTQKGITALLGNLEIEIKIVYMINLF